ncbi:MAG: hypothetical protein U0326_14810 [Polyangiales bacterium]
MKRFALLLALLAGCADDAAAPTPPAGPGIRCESPKGVSTMVIARFGFVRADTTRAGVSDGFDLDDHDTAPGESVGCGRQDYTAPDGRHGVDNQLALLIPVVDSMTGGALDGAIQTAINGGQLLMTITLEDLDNRCNDPSVTMVFRRVTGMPFVGSDMRVDPGQTFDQTRDLPVTRAHGRVENGVLVTDATNIPLPVEVLDARFTLNLYGARMRLRLDDAGGAEGIIGGGISISEFTATAENFTIPMSLRGAIGTTMRLVADLAPDDNGRCQQLSAAVSLSLRPAFVNP